MSEHVFEQDPNLEPDDTPAIVLDPKRSTPTNPRWMLRFTAEKGWEELSSEDGEWHPRRLRP